ncbi:short transient receptor potential channel 4-like isoform X3 [Biomphalaria glabrata]|nr:short transient receptor potential channel 4-like isoform X3 [Biomphalaria glabrata]XP_055893357.1 short transient receptor potential channel 4-like isoform X3 [Biomphalaria glabrata]XP_055893358.1 short transient receptor potential channel 4-like isoform X3 [Biomphalaria glabrata]XP_055893359.1 short transient receptor potential channel 4-like isoform X3 [Biomphalaria glabrata]
MDKVYLAYRESLLNAAPRMMEELGMDAGEDFLGMGVFRKDVDLTNEEKQYLLSVERGDVPSTRQYLNNSKQTGMNLNCLDPLGRTALLVAIENENIEMIELLLSYGVEVGDALLHAINEENVEAVELLLNHELATKGEQQPLTTTVPSSSFTPDITPIILAGHRDNYEIIKILLDRGYRIPKPHNARCSCKDCITGSQEDSLRHSRSRINAYKALASPSLICLSSKDPILTSFELSCELKQLSKLENEFKADYEKLAVKCQEFAVDLLEQTRGSRELAIILNHDNTTTDEQNCDKVRLSRLKLAIKYKQKKFVAHPNCQQLLASMWYEGLPGFRRRSILSKLTIMAIIGFLFPVLSIVYLIAPKCSIGQLITKPFVKFMIHCSSYIVFLFLLILVSQRVEVLKVSGDDEFRSGTGKKELRGSQASLVEWIILAYVAGLMWSEIKQLWGEGAIEYIHDMWNILDFFTNSLYIATFTLRLLAYLQVQEEKREGDSNADRDRKDWEAYDPNLIAEALFAAANIFSSLKLVNIFTVSPYLGPLQISLGRMIMDLVQFGCIFCLVLFSFASGLNHLYWYYADKHATECRNATPPPHLTENSSCDRKYRSFANLWEIVQSLYWAIYGLVDLDHAELRPKFNHEYTEFVGKLMFGTYSWIALIVLLNMLIAMMSNSYQRIYSQADEEWKFARSKLWISYFEDSGTLPPPFNVIPSPKTVYYIIRWCKNKLCACFCSKAEKRNRWQSIKKIVKKINEKEIRYQAVMRDLIKRYIMQKQRGSQKGEGVNEDDINELKQDVSSFRFELLEILRNNGMKTPNPNQTKPTNRRLSRKKSHMSLDRLRRSMSLETCKVESPGKNPVDVVLERQTNSLKCRYNPPETIPEEEFERIRRESLIPRVGLLAGVGRRRSSVVPPSDGAATVVSTAASSGAFSAAVTAISALKVSTTKVVNGNSNSVVCPDDVVAMATDNMQLEGSDGSNYSQRRDEGLGESFDRYSEMSDSTSRIGIVGSVIELQTLHPTTHSSSPVRYSKTPGGVSSTSPDNSRRNGGTHCGIDDEEYDGMSFTAPPMPEGSPCDPNEIDPLSFLTEAQAKRVTFM